MIFDKSIKKGKLPFSCIDCIKARKFFDKEGYFTNDILEFTKPNFSKSKEVRLSELYDIDNSVNEAPFQSKELGAPFYEYFLPKEWVKEEEKKYRPYTLTEFVNEYSLGDEVIVRKKDGSCGIEHKLFTEYIEGDEDVCFSDFWYALDILFNEYELYTGEGWKPFGVIGVEK